MRKYGSGGGKGVRGEVVCVRICQGIHFFFRLLDEGQFAKGCREGEGVR